MKYLKFIYILILLLPLAVQGQFYNGSQMTFGKNRLQYQEFYWQYYRYPRFDVYYSIGGKELAEYVSAKAEEELKLFESLFEIENDRRIIFIVYNKLSEYKQSNLGLSTSDDEYNIGGTTNIIQNKIAIYNEGSQAQLDKQIRNGIVSLMVHELLYGTDTYKEIFVQSTSGDYPDWFVKGLESFLSNSWSPDYDEKAKYGFTSGRYKKILHLEGEDAVVAGHAFWEYVTGIYGRKVIGNILYISRLSRNVETSILYILGTDLKSLFDAFYKFYFDIYIKEPLSLESGEPFILKRFKPNTYYYETAVAPDASAVAYATEKLGQVKLWVYNINTGKKEKLLKEGWQLEQIVDRSFPVMAWHPSSKLLSVFYELKGKIWFMLYNIEDGSTIVREFHHFDKIVDFSYSPDGVNLVIAGVKKGKTDLFNYNISSFTTTRLTNDMADDFSPEYTSANTIVFSSNRFSVDDADSIKTDFDLFEIDIKTNPVSLKQLTNTNDENESQVRLHSDSQFLFLSDGNGVNLPQVAIKDSAISHIDTAVHYRYFINRKPAGSFTENFYSYDITATGKMVWTEYGGKKKKKRYQILTKELDTVVETSSVAPRYYLKHKQKEEQKNDSIKKAKAEAEQEEIAEIITTVDINDYVFEFEKYSSQEIDSIFNIDNNQNQSAKRPSVYQRHFYVNKIVNQVDFSFLNTSYQSFTGGAVYFNPGLNAFVKLGAIDLFEDYRLTGGIRIAGNLQSNEYLLQVENLKKRLDKKYVLYRKLYKQQIDPLTVEKVNDHHLMAIFTYPLSAVGALRFTPGLKQDRHIYQATSYATLKQKDLYQFWGSLKLEYIFDNSLPKQQNIHYKTRLKVFAEYYNLLNNFNSSLGVIGCDVRNYSKLHRNLIWAKRFAYSRSMGNNQLIYYLGSVDNWVNLFSGYETYNDKIDYDHNINWTFQTIGTNLRGFNQNIRNGNSFALMNNEIRWPVFSYLANRPMSSDFMKNYQLIGFFDIGAAWTGWLPNNENAYNIETVTQGPITVEIDKQRSPLVAGYGFGMRSRLFGYFIRADWAWGIENGYVMPRIFYLSLSLDF